MEKKTNISSYLEQLSEENYQWDDISYLGPCCEIIDRTNNIIRISNGSIRYNLRKFDSYLDAIRADYQENPSDEQLMKSISLVFPELIDQKKMFGWFKNNLK